MSKYSKEFKLAVIQYYLSGRGGFKTVAERYGVKYAYVRKWVHAYQIHGQKSFIKGCAKYTGTFKLSVLQYMEQHQLSINQAAAHFNIPAPSTIGQWQRLYNQDGITALEPKPKGRPRMSKPFKPFTPTNKPVTQMTPEELMQELEYRRVETDYLKKLEALAQQKHLASKNKSKSSLS
jgi:transposase-like protein